MPIVNERDQFAGEARHSARCAGRPAERIIEYLATRHGMNINAVFFRYVKLSSGDEILARSILVPDAITSRTNAVPSIQELLKIADNRKVRSLVDIIRSAGTFWTEAASARRGGSLFYWTMAQAGWRMLFRLDLSGSRSKSPDGELAVWVKFKNIAEISGVDEPTILSSLGSICPKQDVKKASSVLPITTNEQAEKLVQQLKTWSAGPNAQHATA